LFYVLADAPAGPVHVAGWIIVGIGVVMDLSSWAQGARNRDALNYGSV
jgi:hypothetical protein